MDHSSVDVMESPAQGPRTGWRLNPRQTLLFAARWTVGLMVIAILAYVFYRGAELNARVVNKSSRPGDQSSYLDYAKDIYNNRHDSKSNILGDRNRMPLYPLYLSYYWDPQKMPDIRDGQRLRFGQRDLFFEAAKIANIYLAIGLLITLFFVLRAILPPLAATSLALVVAFGIFIFKAGYTQAELLFYFLFFCSFLLMCQLVRRPSWWLAPIAGAIIAVTHLSKAAMLPILGLFYVALFLRFATTLISSIRARSQTGWRRWTPPLQCAAVALLVGGAFLATLWPYISNSKRVFGHYFYNVNSTFYIWYDTWAQATRGTKAAGDRVGWPKLPPEKLPSFERYWREHTAQQIQARFSKGFQDMLRESYEHYDYFKFVCLWVLFALLLISLRPRLAWHKVSSNGNWAVLVFALMYFATYLPLCAFYAPISATGTTRFLLAHLTPLLFLLTCLTLVKSGDADESGWRSRLFKPAYFHAAVILIILSDIPFFVWPRLMEGSKFGGF